MTMVTREAVHEQLKNHTIELRLLLQTEHGRYLHLRCSNNGCSSMMFNVMAVPGRLMYFGSMGSYVFERTNDMIAWFGADNGRDPDFRYLAEKVIAQDKYDGLKQRSKVRFKEALESYIDDEQEMGADLVKEVRLAINTLLNQWDELGPERAISEATEFYLGPSRKPTFQFVELWDFSFDEYTGRFLWACHAIRWAIAKWCEAAKEMECASS